MSHIKDRLSDYHDFTKKLADNHQMFLASDVSEMIEQLQDDLEQDEKENGDYPANTSDAGFVEGWNQCIDEITGGNSDD